MTFKLWTPKSYSNWARIHKVSEVPQTIQIPQNVQLVHDITKYGYTEEAKIAQRSSLSLASPETYAFNSGVTQSAWNSKAHNFLFHLAFKISSGADDDADARLCFVVLIPNTSGTSSTYVPLSEQFIIPKITSEESMLGFTLPMPFLMQPSWYPGVFWNGALAASTGTLQSVHIESEE